MKRRTLTNARREAIWAYILISPWIVGFIIFVFGPMIASLILSFTKYNISDPAVFVGVTNYTTMFADPRFWHSLRVTFSYAIVALPLGLIVGFLLALLLNAKVPGLAFWRTIYYMPSVTSAVASSVLFLYIFNPRFGIANWVLSLVGIFPGPGWLSSPQWALPTLIIMSLWGVGGGMIIYLGGLQSIPTALYDAAVVDGANSWQRFSHITLPMMTPVIFYNLVTGIIGSFQYFTQAYVVTNGDGGPVDSTLFYNLYLYSHAFRYNSMGFASALAWFLFILVLVLTLLVFRSSALWLYYEGELKR